MEDRAKSTEISELYEFRLREYEALQEKIQHAVQDLARTETIVPIAMAALYAWLTKDGSTVATQAPWTFALPPILALIGLLRQEARYSYLRTAENYIRLVEADMYGDADPNLGASGWEHFYDVHRTRGHRALRAAIWIALILLSGYFAALKICAASAPH